MDLGERRNFFVCESALIEVVTPLFTHRIQTDFEQRGHGCFEDFLNDLDVKHTLYHLHKSTRTCCTDKRNCAYRFKSPLNNNQWITLYLPTPGPRHYCHCCFKAKNGVQLTDIDISLAGIILKNCCNLQQHEEEAIVNLRDCRNLLCHNTSGCINEVYFKLLWGVLTQYVLQLDSSKQNNLDVIEKRPLDEALCKKYHSTLIDIHSRLDDISQEMHGIEEKFDKSLTEIKVALQNIEKNAVAVNQERNSRNDKDVEILYQRDQDTDPVDVGFARCQVIDFTTDTCYTDAKYQLKGDSLNEPLEKRQSKCKFTSGIFLEDEDVIISCFVHQSLVIGHANGKFQSVFLSNRPLCIAAFDSSTVAVTLHGRDEIAICDTKRGLVLTFLEVPYFCWGITSIQDNLVVSCANGELLLINNLGSIYKSFLIKVTFPYKIHSADGRIFHTSSKNMLTCINYFGNSLFKITLPEQCMGMTSLPGRTICIALRRCTLLCASTSDGTILRQLKIGLDFNPRSISYNKKLRKMFILHSRSLRVFVTSTVFDQ